MLKVGFLGESLLLKWHIAQWEALNTVKIIGYAGEDSTAQLANFEFFTEPALLVQDIDVLVICSFTEAYFEAAEKALLASKHIFWNNAYSLSAAQLLQLAQLATEARVACHVHFAKRQLLQFHAADRGRLQIIDVRTTVSNKQDCTTKELFHRYLFEDVDLVLHSVRSRVKKVSGKMLSLQTEKCAVIQAGIEFDNGTLASFLMRYLPEAAASEMQLFGSSSFSSIDLNSCDSLHYAKKLNQEIAVFIQSIQQGSVNKISIFDALYAKEIVEQIMKNI